MPPFRITFNQVNAATLHVQREFTHLGLWHAESRLLEANVYWCIIPQPRMWDVQGIFFHGTAFLDRVLGYKDGHIYIPQFILSNMIFGQSFSLRDTIRHEYGHAFAHYYEDLIAHNNAFVDAFGAPYYSYEPVNMPSEAFVSKYASTMPMEDFAETFMVYVRRKGELLPRHTNRLLKRKWKFVERVIKQA
jgi:hypothetical protein